jgi:hypothetical protein
MEKELTNRLKRFPNMPRLILSYQRYEKRHIAVGQELVIDKASFYAKMLVRET